MNDPILDALMLSEQLRTAEAIKLIERLLQLDPTHSRAWYILGIFQMQTERYDEAIGSFVKSIFHDHNSEWADSCRFCYGYAQLARESYREGFWGFEYRYKAPIPELDERQNIRNAPISPGEDLVGKTILIHDDSGHGDVIQFARYLPKLVKLGLQVWAVVPPALLPALASIEGVNAVGRGSPLPKCDYWERWMSLAHVCATHKVEDIPPPTELHWDLDKFGKWEKWLRLLQDVDNFNVGLCWLGNHKGQDRKYRIAQFHELEPLLDLTFKYPRLQFWSLHQQQSFHPHLFEAGVEFKDFSDTSHLMKKLDLVITVDTANAHMAGTIGTPTWLFVDRVRPYWVWAGTKDSSPWYPSIKMYRQDIPGDWTAVVQRMTRDLEALLSL